MEEKYIYWREKSIFRFFGALFFSLYALALLFAHSYTHTAALSLHSIH
jgi:hypothetical protein